MAIRFPDYERHSNFWMLVILAMGGLIFLFFDIYFDNPGRGAIAMISFNVLAVSFGENLKYRSNTWFLVFYFFATVTHLAVIFGRDWAFTRGNAMAVYGPFIVLDFIVITGLVLGLAWLMKRKDS